MRDAGGATASPQARAAGDRAPARVGRPAAGGGGPAVPATPWPAGGQPPVAGSRLHDPLDTREPVYTMGVAERLTGLSQRQIRYYEARGLIRLRRTPSGQRLLTAADIRQLRRIRQLLQQGHNIHSLRVLLAAPPRCAPEGGAQHATTLPSPRPLPEVGTGGAG